MKISRRTGLLVMASMMGAITGSAQTYMVGQFSLAASSNTLSAPTVLMDGSSGTISASTLKVTTGNPGILVSTSIFFNGSPWADVRAFGAKLDGTTDDTAALIAAEAALPSTGGTIFVPPGTMRISSWKPVRPNTVLLGAGMQATKIQGNTSTPTLVNIVGLSNGSIRDLTLDSAGLSTTTLNLSSNGSMGNWLISHVYLIGASSTTIVIGDTGSHQASEIAFVGVVALSTAPSTAEIYVQGSNTLDIAWYGGSIGCASCLTNIYLTGGNVGIYDANFAGASTDIYKMSGQIMVRNGHTESWSFYWSSPNDSQSSASAVDIIENLQGSIGGPQFLYHQAGRALVLTGVFMGGNARIGTSGIVYAAGNAFASGSDFIVEGQGQLYGGKVSVNGSRYGILHSTQVFLGVNPTSITPGVDKQFDMQDQGTGKQWRLQLRNYSAASDDLSVDIYNGASFSEWGSFRQSDLSLRTNGPIIANSSNLISGNQFQVGGGTLAVTSSGHVITNGTLPTTTLCNNQSVNANSNDMRGSVTFSGGAQATCTINFANAGGVTTPFCTCSDASTPTAVICAPGPGRLVVTLPAPANDTIVYNCQW